MRDEYDKMAEKILADRLVRHRNRTPTKEYLVRWRGLPEAEISWEPIAKL